MGVIYADSIGGVQRAQEVAQAERQRALAASLSQLSEQVNSMNQARFQQQALDVQRGHLALADATRAELAKYREESLRRMYEIDAGRNRIQQEYLDLEKKKFEANGGAAGSGSINDPARKAAYDRAMIMAGEGEDFGAIQKAIPGLHPEDAAFIQHYADTNNRSLSYAYQTAQQAAAGLNQKDSIMKSLDQIDQIKKSTGMLSRYSDEQRKLIEQEPQLRAQLADLNRHFSDPKQFAGVVRYNADTGTYEPSVPAPRNYNPPAPPAHPAETNSALQGDPGLMQGVPTTGTPGAASSPFHYTPPDQFEQLPESKPSRTYQMPRTMGGGTVSYQELNSSPTSTGGGQRYDQAFYDRVNQLVSSGQDLNTAAMNAMKERQAAGQ